MGEIHKNLEEDQIEYRSEYSKTIMYFVTKRIIDILGSIIGLLLLSPILIITAIVIKLDSKGPIFFIQERVGKNGEYFNMYKFRSMVIDAEEKLYQLKDKNEMSGPMFKMKNDPRVTRVGSFIRRTSIDELPQLFNVLKGEMSLVGPRPNLPREVIKFTDYQKDKLLAKPGITCYWQVMGRNNIDFEQWIELDVKYVRERSTWVDIKLIFKTVGLLLGDENAA
ncbi:sugar transferase [Clostridium sporogenes]|uniref:sugar transferase n=1 Tax=Clostridium sporogenes TaxID=1509 RepID=UPI0013C5FFA4|nr:exopolysaccharide biosynthesis polyprenyl glycosylphosphotransferase [Clostridium sporogenes]NFQ00906.1 exopolysaccharide biosynthesis polyprenyl glycosylphosphotransferase [Clostridium sporogenes]NFQ40969.1 exopolysaccharide biosynthesis polyprenyl glycosylphosphotransferase [Clostridium sporogenes]